MTMTSNKQDAEQQLYCPRDILPPAWTLGKTLEDYIQGVMHIVFLGAGRMTIHLETSWLKAKRKGSAFIKIVSPLVDSIQKLQLRWLPLQRYKESLGGYVSENVLAYIRLMPWTYIPRQVSRPRDKCVEGSRPQRLA
jgi:hypothetical protein